MKNKTGQIFAWNTETSRSMIDPRKYIFTAEDWIKVSDRLPPIGETVLIFIDHPSRALRSGMFKGRLVHLNAWVVHPNYAVLSDFQVTHWMPMPEDRQAGSHKTKHAERLKKADILAE